MKILFIVISATLLLSLAACSNIDEFSVLHGPPLIEPAVPVVTGGRVTVGNVETKTIRQGVVRVESQAVLLQSASGRFGRFYVRPGDEVTQGQLIARMDVEHIHEQIEIITERIANMRRTNQFDNEERALEIDLLELNYTATIMAAAEAFDENAMDAAQAVRNRIEWANLNMRHAIERQAMDMRDAEARLAELRASLAYTDIVAPFDGTIVNFATGRGHWINTAETVLYMTCTNPAIFVEYIGQTMNQHQARLPIMVRGHAHGEVFGMERMLLTAAQQSYYTRMEVSLPIRYEIPSDISLSVGTPVAIHLYTVWYENVVRVPQNALFACRVYGDYVYLLIDGAMVQTFVTIGRVTESFAPVFSGVSEGDEIFVRS